MMRLCVAVLLVIVVAVTAPLAAAQQNLRDGVQMQQQDKMVLLDLYAKTDGPNWKPGWNVAKDLCGQYGVTCDQDGFVTKLQMDANRMQGVLPDSLGTLKRITTLSLTNQFLPSGPIPMALGKLATLQVLDLSGNSFNKLPGSLGRLSSLRVLNVSNQDAGDLTYVPDELCSLVNLETLDLSYNTISTLPDCIDQWQQLKCLIISHNRLYPFYMMLPESLGLISGLKKLVLFDGRMQVPLSLGNLTQLEYLDLSYIPRGPWPDLSRLTQLRFLSLYEIGLPTVPQYWAKMVHLEEFSISDTKAPSELPDLSNLKHLRALTLKRCKLVGSIPSMSALTNLVYLDLSENQLSGGFPTSVLSAPLKTIDLSYNNLTGLVPQEVVSLARIGTRVLLKANNFSCPVPDYGNDYSYYRFQCTGEYCPAVEILCRKPQPGHPPLCCDQLKTCCHDKCCTPSTRCADTAFGMECVPD